MDERNRGRRPVSGAAAGGRDDAARRRRRPALEQPDKKAASGSWFGQHKRQVFFGGFAAVVLAVAIFAGVFVNAMQNPFSVLERNSQKPVKSSGTSSAGNGLAAIAPSSSPEDVPPDYNFDQQRVNILVLGTDADQQRIKEGMNARTDCIMLVSIELDTKKVSIISIPRDTYTKMYGAKSSLGYFGKINAAFSYGGGLKKNGVDYAINTVRHFMGNVPIDYYVLFDMDLVKSLVNAVGGLRYNMDMDVTIDNYHFTKGWTTLTGDLALRYARDRHHTPGGDFGRVDHQQKIMVALFEQLKNKKQLSMVPKLYESLSQNITTNMNALQVAALAWFARDLDINSVMRYTISGSCYNIGGSSVVLSDQQEKVKILKDVFGINAPVIAEESAPYLKKKVDEAYNAGKNLVSTAQSYLNANGAYYTADEAAGLKAAIASWNSAKRKNDADAMADAQDDVEAQYNSFRAMVEARKHTPTPEPTESVAPEETPSEQPDETATEPAETRTPKPEDTETTKPTATHTEKPSEAPSATHSSAPEESQPADSSSPEQAAPPT